MTATATPLVLLHAPGQAPMAWEDVVVPLYGSRRLLTPWVPGLKPTDRRPLPLPDAAAALDQQLMLEGLQAVDVCGVGLGAMVAAQLAADHPDRVRRLVLVGGQVRPSRTALRLQAGMVRLMPQSRLADSGVSKDRLLEALAAARDLDLSAALPRVVAPTLVVVGARDRAGQLGARALEQAIAGARLRVVEGAGPMVNEDAPAALVQVLRDFLD
ncbi:alpha/beta fold hydrolase [Ornithinimicrobium tianjinense]|uniref:3-oxoadipate enol-lactone hydrolase n=1 Tax=Ornithinimicrobium tianjinense TaxID=1195761 RepID=A0A917EZY4_9MICO|nr:alpha/beta hydrolase [Ornithinimicrobium tianjinense]GGF36594.1 3-oxoadipate enol-lactone hydrolase [Ornithinimicrobium tianjinense]